MEADLFKLISVDVKIRSKAIALRLQTVLPKIIHHNQHAYVKGRTINDTIRAMDEILVYNERYGYIKIRIFKGLLSMESK